MSSNLRKRIRVVLLVGVGLLYVVSIPWYRTGGAEPAMWAGLPEWVAVALFSYGTAAIAIAIVWLLTDVPEREEGP